jgi:Tol biopolymer transport system component/DNA-binding winged helix-turn-helix (wHTH) protein
MVTGVQQRTVRFGLFEVDLVTAELFKAGRKVDLERQPFVVLTLLLKSRGELVARDELQAALWPDGSFVDFNQGLNVAVKKLRDALGDSSENPRFIETLSRRGYRFIAPMEWVQETKADQVSQPETTQDSLWPWVWAAVSLALAMAVLFYWRAGSSKSSDTPNLELRPSPLTSYPGFERSPALSPDGRQVAFSWDGDRQDNPDIYVKLLDTANPVRLTRDPASDDMPTWAPDGLKIAFVRTEKSRRSSIRIIPALGGPERELAELAPVECYRYGTLSWSPNGEWLAFADKARPGDPFTLYMVSVATGDKRKITSVATDLYGDAVPAFSPDGRSLAFVRLRDYSNGDVYLMPLVGGQPRQLTHDCAGVFGLSWTADSKELVFSSDRAGDSRLWRIASSGGTPQPLLGISGSDVARGVYVRGYTLVFAREISDQNIWRLPVQGPKMTGLPKQLSVSTRDDMNPQPSPDGKRIAFSSNRSGSIEIWVSDSEGLNPMQVTSIGRGTNVWATWSPDGRFLAFNSDISELCLSSSAISEWV